MPRFQGLLEVGRSYVWGVFRGEPHPHRMVYWRKLNPLQVASYFAMKMAVFPAIWVPGLLYLTYKLWEGPDASGALTLIADIHVLAAYAIGAFVITHVYLLTLGQGFRAHVRPMIDGCEDIDLTPEQEAHLETNEPGRLRKKDLIDAVGIAFGNLSVPPGGRDRRLRAMADPFRAGRWRGVQLVRYSKPEDARIAGLLVLRDLVPASSVARFRAVLIQISNFAAGCFKAYLK